MIDLANAIATRTGPCRGGTLRVRLEDPEGRTVPRVRVTLRDAATRRFAPDLRLVPLRAGEVMSRVPVGHYLVQVEAEPDSPAGWGTMLLPAEAPSPVAVEPGAITTVSLRAERGGRVRVALEGPRAALVEWAPGRAGRFRPLRLLRPTPRGWSVGDELDPGTACVGYDLLRPGRLVLRARTPEGLRATALASVEAGGVRDVTLRPDLP